MARSQRVYFAGRIKKNDWRHNRVPGLRNALDIDDAFSPWVEGPVLPITGSALSYGGPYFLADDHGCAHGACTHGGLASGCIAGLVRESDSEQRAAVAKRCALNIDSSDAVFAWVEDYEAYGTLVEVGIAWGKNIPVYVYVPVDFDQSELWFAEQMVVGNEFRRAHTVEAALDDFLFEVEIRPSLISSL